ncbi:hypothetical protein WA1_10000 [Scytonema hofmannii PCC 7110]|uniref:Uncharacterized protein n=1 Tax=Scytonema hofmannii PCC 7110 TaxID=128403 RepID=A0A139WRJ8_9CYAN|nr:hypothetical protein WA1_10000 [Scytonema hofmannii PCC 7110]
MTYIRKYHRKSLLLCIFTSFLEKQDLACPEFTAVKLLITLLDASGGQTMSVFVAVKVTLAFSKHPTQGTEIIVQSSIAQE